jgi:hypothetical protein
MGSRKVSNLGVHGNSETAARTWRDVLTFVCLGSVIIRHRRTQSQVRSPILSIADIAKLVRQGPFDSEQVTMRAAYRLAMRKDASRLSDIRRQTTVTRSAAGSVGCRSIPVRRFPIFCSLHQLFESCAAFEQRTFERGLERLFGAGIVERHPVLTHRRH